MKANHPDRMGDDGYAVIPGFLQPDECARSLRAVENVLASPRHPGMSRPGNDLTPLRWNDYLVSSILQSDGRREKLRNALQPHDLKWLSGYISTKIPHSPPLCWHQDWWCWDNTISFQKRAPQVAILCYLTETSPSSGALRILPGSHHRSSALHAFLPEPHGPDTDGLAPNHPAMSDAPGQVTLALGAGDAVAIDYRLLHGTHANETAAARHCILLSFVPDWSELPHAVKSHLISHPALPEPADLQEQTRCSYEDLLPCFAGVRTSLPINRVAPLKLEVEAALRSVW